MILLVNALLHLVDFLVCGLRMSQRCSESASGLFGALVAQWILQAMMVIVLLDMRRFC